MEPTIVAAIIQTSGSIITTRVAGYLGKQWLNQQKLKEKLKIARDDIQFLLQVEKYFLENTKDDDLMSGRNNVRKYIAEQGYKWSGQNTPGRVKNDII